MARFLKDQSNKLGEAPGSLLSVSDQKYDGIKIRITNFNETVLEEFEVDKIEDCQQYIDVANTVTWIDIEGSVDSKTIETIGKSFGIHRLWLEDVLNTDHRPKIEELDDLLFVIIKSVFQIKKKIVTEQVSLFLGDGFVLSFQERKGDTFLAVRHRLRQSKWIIRKSGPDYLLYAMIDVVVDHYFIILESIGLQIEKLEGEFLRTSKSNLPMKISTFKNELLFLNKACKPVKEFLSHICRATHSDIKKDTLVYFNDALEHSVQIVDTIETYKQMLNTIMDSYQSMMNHKMNESMKVLTVFATIFIPLTFIAGIYGMNFQFMPELQWKYGYFYVLGLMVAVFVGLLVYIKKKDWL